MDAWASPWADDTHEGEDPGHRRTASTLQDFQDFELFGDDYDPLAETEHTGDDGSLAFTSKLDSSDFGGASVWATDINTFGVDSSSAWASDSNSVPVLGANQHSDTCPNWEEGDIVPGETQKHETINIGNISTSEEKTSHAYQSSSSVIISTKEFPDDWSHQLQPDWHCTTEDQPTSGEALPTVVNAHQRESSGFGFQHDSPSVTSAVMAIAEEQTLALTLPEEGVVETVPTSSFDEDTNEHLVPVEEPAGTAEILPHKSLFENDESIEGEEAEKSKHEPGVENNQSGVTPEAQEDDDDFGDFGDVEEGGIEDEKFEMEPEPDPVVTTKTSSLSPLDFTIDSSLASKLYPVMQKPPIVPLVEEVISTTSARKAWYRISRDGTMGKHNSGDGDDYVRVTWSKSKVRANVCEIVNRWIKEGRFAVSDAIGGDRSYGAIFGWGDGANASPKHSGQKGNRSSAPLGLGSAGYTEGSKSIHKASISISSWDPPAPGKSKTSSAVDFGWGSPKVSKTETAATKDTTSPTKEQIFSSTLLSNSSNSVSAETSNALKDLVLDPPMKPHFQTLQTSTKPVQTQPKPQHNGIVAIETEADNWEDFENTPMSNTSISEVTNSRQTHQDRVPSVSGGDTWASLDVFEEGTASNITHTSPQATRDSNLRDLRLCFNDEPNEKPTTLLQFESAVGDDDWGEMINSPATPVNPPPPLSPTATTIMAPIKNRRPSTAHGQTNPFGTFQVGVLGAPDVAPARRDSAPSLFSPMNGHPTVFGAVVSTETNLAPVVDWDFSVFERPAKKDIIPTLSATAQISALSGSTLLGGSQVLSKEDKVVMDILEGLPDMGYMLR